MSTLVKDNEHIRRDDSAFKNAVRRAQQEFGRIEGVVGVGYGLKEVAGEFTEELAILVYVAAKRPETELAEEHTIPSRFGGYRTDVRVALPSRPQILSCDDDKPYETITGGIQIEAAGKLTPKNELGRGTLACIVHKRGDTGDDNVYLLTCHHVLLHEDRLTRAGDGVYHPYFPRTSPVVKKGTLLGKIDTALVRLGHVDVDGKPRDDEPSTEPAPLVTDIDLNYPGFYVDCAAVRIDLGSFCCGSACTRNDIKYDTTIPSTNLPPHPPALDPGDVDRIVDVRDLRDEPAASVIGMRVIKNGRTTGRTVGRIAALGASHSLVEYPVGSTPRVIGFRYNVIQIILDGPTTATNICTGLNEFSSEGDSGALIVDEQNRAVALLYAGKVGANDAGVFVTDACHIVPVLKTLGMCIPTTTGTSPGSSKAMDGSGLAAYHGEPDLLRDDGQVLFSGHSVASTQASPLGAPATEEQRALMQPLLDDLLKTERGCELHEAFSQLSREIAWLVRHNRQVKVTWHRNHGPAFLACVLNHLKGEAEAIPREAGGIERATLLERMGKMLSVHGSNPLREAIERHRELLLSLSDADTAAECLESIRRAEEEAMA